MSYGHINFQLTQKDILNFLLKTTWPIKEVNLGRWGGGGGYLKTAIAKLFISITLNLY